MSEERKQEGLSEEELERENGEALPDREQMSVLKQPWEPEPLGGNEYVSPIERPVAE
jgi:hypothetical protein